jgi:serine protease AprX
MFRNVEKKIAYALAIITLLCICSINSSAENNPPGAFGYLPNRLPSIITQPILEKLASDQANQIWGFIGRNYEDKNLTELPLSFLALQAFDMETRWPIFKQMPNGFKPMDWLEIGKDPGLGIRKIHIDGITGRGISVAVIDKPIRFTHIELKDRIIYIKVFGDNLSGLSNHFHGLACASILAGTSCGVAPEANLYYFAVPDNGKNFLNYSLAIDRLVEINEKLSMNQKIRIVSISDGMIGPYIKEWNTAKGKLATAGIELIFSTKDILSGFVWGGCPPYLDRQLPDVYDFSPYLKENNPRKGSIIIPSDSRTTASNASDSVYVYWGQGGWSWAMPYIAGLSALAWQLDPGLKYSQIEKLLKQTATTRPDGYRVLSPEAFIESIRKLHKQIQSKMDA